MSEDHDLLRALQESLEPAGFRLSSVVGHESGTRLPGEALPPIVLYDMRNESRGSRDIAALSRTRPGTPVLALIDHPASRAVARASGAMGVIEVGKEPVTDACHNLRRLLLATRQSLAADPLVGGMGRFRRMVFDMQSGLSSTTMALNLMHVISESVERAVLFLLQGEEPAHELLSVGAFGFSESGEPLASRTQALRWALPQRGLFRAALTSAEPQAGSFEKGEIPPALAQLLGRPASGQAVVFPVLGAQKVVALIYTDNGDRTETIEDIRILELATAQVGVAFENELLRHQERGALFAREAWDQPGEEVGRTAKIDESGETRRDLE